jgi:hypothetical protein
VWFLDFPEAEPDSDYPAPTARQILYAEQPRWELAQLKKTMERLTVPQRREISGALSRGVFKIVPPARDEVVSADPKIATSRMRARRIERKRSVKRVWWQRALWGTRGLRRTARQGNRTMIRLAALASAVLLLAVQPGPIGATQGRPIGAFIGIPVVEGISRVDAKQYQTIVIRGRNFGENQLYGGDSDYFYMVDVQGNGTGWWRAGCVTKSGNCGTTLSVSSWTDNTIVVTRFTGDGLYQTMGDLVSFFIWNPQTGRGPAAAAQMVK